MLKKYFGTCVFQEIFQGNFPLDHLQKLFKMLSE